MARIGTSGWSYDHWSGVLYEPGLNPARRLDAYVASFDTVELNSTFYRLPSVTTVERWAAEAPAGFQYAVKVGAYGTHRRKLADAGRWLPNHLDRVQRLGPSLGPNLVQLPPRWRRDVARLDAFLTLAPRALRWAVELRDESWLHDDVYETLARHDAGPLERTGGDRRRPPGRLDHMPDALAQQRIRLRSRVADHHQPVRRQPSGRLGAGDPASVELERAGAAQRLREGVGHPSRGDRHGDHARGGRRDRRRPRSRHRAAGAAGAAAVREGRQPRDRRPARGR